jgi:hypothetical protein
MLACSILTIIQRAVELKTRPDEQSFDCMITPRLFCFGKAVYTPVLSNQAFFDTLPWFLWRQRPSMLEAF